jgi:hypothetical protein
LLHDGGVVQRARFGEQIRRHGWWGGVHVRTGAAQLWKESPLRCLEKRVKKAKINPKLTL